MQETVTTMRARDYMRAEVHTVTPDTSLADVVAFLVGHGISSAPVVELREDRRILVGYVSEHDCLQALANELFYGSPVPSRTVAGIMRRHPVCASPDTELFALASILVNHSLRHLPIVEGDELRGIVSRRDILGSLERVYRDLLQATEKRLHPPDLSQLASMRFVVSGR